MRKVELRMNEDYKYIVIKKCYEGKVSKAYCEIKLNLTRRSIDRLLANYHLHGKAAFLHGNRNRKPVTTKTEQLQNDILLLYQNKYQNSNFSHFTELLKEHEDIHVSESFIRNLFRENSMLPPKAWRRTKRAETARLKALSTNSKISSKSREVALAKLLDLEDSHPRRPRCANFGELLQMDASLHLWYGSMKTTLHASIDDATGKVTGLYMDHQETLNGYYNILYQTLVSYGIPYAFLTDRRTVFEYKKVSSPNIEKDTFTQFSYACSILGTDISTTSVAQAKGRVERLFQTLQTRLPVEFRLNGISTLEEANEFLSHYKDKFNKQFSLPIHSNRNVFTEQPEPERINQILAILSPRVVDSGHCIKFKNEYYLPLNKNGVKQFFLRGTKGMVIEAFDKIKYLTVDDNVYILEKVEKRAETSPALDGSEKPKIKKQYIPPMSHPWKSKSFESFINKSKKAQAAKTCMEA